MASMDFFILPEYRHLAVSSWDKLPWISSVVDHEHLVRKEKTETKQPVPATVPECEPVVPAKAGEVVPATVPGPVVPAKVGEFVPASLPGPVLPIKVEELAPATVPEPLLAAKVEEVVPVTIPKPVVIAKVEEVVPATIPVPVVIAKVEEVVRATVPEPIVLAKVEEVVPVTIREPVVPVNEVASRIVDRVPEAEPVEALKADQPQIPSGSGLHSMASMDFFSFPECRHLAVSSRDKLPWISSVVDHEHFVRKEKTETKQPVPATVPEREPVVPANVGEFVPASLPEPVVPINVEELAPATVPEPLLAAKVVGIPKPVVIAKVEEVACGTVPEQIVLAKVEEVVPVTIPEPVVPVKEDESKSVDRVPEAEPVEALNADPPTILSGSVPERVEETKDVTTLEFHGDGVDTNVAVGESSRGTMTDGVEFSGPSEVTQHPGSYSKALEVLRARVSWMEMKSQEQEAKMELKFQEQKATIDYLLQQNKIFFGMFKQMLTEEE